MSELFWERYELLQVSYSVVLNRLFCHMILEYWICYFCFKKWAKPIEKNCNGC